MAMLTTLHVWLALGSESGFEFPANNRVEKCQRTSQLGWTNVKLCSRTNAKLVVGWKPDLHIIMHIIIKNYSLFAKDKRTISSDIFAGFLLRRTNIEQQTAKFCSRTNAKFVFRLKPQSGCEGVACCSYSPTFNNCHQYERCKYPNSTYTSIK